MRIPKTYFQINIAQGVALGKIPESLTRVEKDIQVLSILTFKPVSYFESMPRGELLKLAERTSWVGDEMPTSKVKRFRRYFDVYRFKTKAEQLSNEEFVLLQKFQDNPMDNLHKTMAVLGHRKRPFKDSMKEFEYKAELFEKRLPFGIAIAYTLFFSHYYPILSKIILSSLKGQLRAIKEVQEMSPSHG